MKNNKAQFACARALKSLGDDTRLWIAKELGKGPKHVGEINSKLRLPQSLLSHHLAVLKRGGVVTSLRDGKKVLYQLKHKIRKKTVDSSFDLGCCLLKFKDL